MQRIDTSNAVAIFVPSGIAGTPGHFDPGDPGTGQRATDLSADWCESVQEELVAILAWLGVTPSKANNNQIATALAIALALKAPLASPALTGTPTAPTAAPGTSSTQLANTAFVTAAIAALINAAPGTLDTLKELADALGDNPNFATTITNALALKAPLASPALTGTPTAPTAPLGTSTTQLATTGFVTSAIATNGKIYCSADITFANGDHISVAHGISLSKVLSVDCGLVCVASDAGYPVPVGTVIDPNSNTVGSGNDHGVTVGANGTSIYYSVSNNGIYVTNYSSPANATLTPANWKLRISFTYLP